MHFAVTGGCGFIGSHIVQELLGLGHKVTVVDNLATSSLDNLGRNKDKVRFFRVDIRNRQDLEGALGGVEGVFHEAALISAKESFEKEREYHDVNVNGSENVLSLASKMGLKTVIASSAAVYGHAERIPIREDFPLNPINPYGSTKVRMEQICKEHVQAGLEAVILRYFNVYGRGQGRNVISSFVSRLSECKSPVIYGDGTQVRDFVHVTDAVGATVQAMLRRLPSGLTANTGSGKPTRIRELAELAMRTFNKKTEPIFEDGLPGDIRASVADISVARENLGFEASISLEDGFRTLI